MDSAYFHVYPETKVWYKVWKEYYRGNISKKNCKKKYFVCKKKNGISIEL